MIKSACESVDTASVRRAAIILLVGALACGLGSMAATAGADASKAALACKEGQRSTKRKPCRPAPARFPSGLYYLAPSLDHPGGTLRLLGKRLARTFSLDGSTGWAIDRKQLVWAAGSDVHVVTPRGADRVVHVRGLYAIARPTLSPDGTRIAVQATETPIQGAAPPRFLTVYVIRLSNGSWKRLVAKSANPLTGNELPEWHPTGRSIAHQGIGDLGASADGNPCNVFNVVDASTGAVRLTIRNDGVTGCYRPVRGVLDGPRFHMAFARDGKRLLSVGQMRTYDTTTGVLLADIHDRVLSGLASAGYEPDDRFPGQGGGGTFPLDGTFSPDGRQIVFDGAVRRGGSYGVLLARVNADGSGLKVLGGPFKVDPRFSNNHNYSQLNPHWLP